MRLEGHPTDADPNAAERFLEFFTVAIRNRHNRLSSVFRMRRLKARRGITENGLFTLGLALFAIVPARCAVRV